ncbi:MAG: hypothetical protein MZV65_40605, partial [Chromatiales bacterium]|nr:hypothetical protein [Chromatiales bacterium]
YFVQLRIAKVNLVTGTQDSSTYGQLGGGQAQIRCGQGHAADGQGLVQGSASDAAAVQTGVAVSRNLKRKSLLTA